MKTPEKPKKLIKLVIGNKKIVKKVDLETKLNEFREIVKDSIPEKCNFMLDDFIIEKNDEKEYTINEIQKNNQVFCSINTTSINIYLNNKNIAKIDIDPDEKIDTLIKELGGKNLDKSKIKYEDTEITLEEAKKEEITIKDLACNNSLYFINEQKDDDQPKIDKKSEKFIHIYKNGEAIKMGSVDTKMSLASLRNIMKNNLSEKANFLSEGSEVPINDENTILLEDIIKENKIYIADSNQSKPEKNENIPIILKIDEKNNFIIKANLSDKLDTIREQNFNIITNDYLFTLKGNIITKEQENIFSIKDITDQSKTVLLKNIKPKIKIKIIEDNNSVKSEQNYDPSDKLSKLRKDLGLESNKVFRRGEAEIDIEDEDN